MPPLRGHAEARSAVAEFAGVGWDTTRALLPFSNEFANMLVQSNVLPPGAYAHDHGAAPGTQLSTNAFDLLALTGIMLNVVHATSLYGQRKGLAVGVVVCFVAFIVPNLLLGVFTDVISGCSIDQCPGTALGPAVIKFGRLAAGASAVWVLEALIELAKEMIMHPPQRHALLSAALPLTASLGWLAALHLGLQHAATGARTVQGVWRTLQARAPWASRAGESRRPAGKRPQPAPSPPPTKAGAAAGAVADATADVRAAAETATAAAVAEAEAAVDAATEAASQIPTMRAGSAAD